MSDCASLKKSLDDCDRFYGTGSNECDSIWQEWNESCGSKGGKKTIRRGGKKTRRH